MATVTATPPVPVVRLVERLRHYLYRIQARLAPPPVAMLDLIVAGWVSQAIEAAAELGVADALVSGPLHPDELARKVGADPDALNRLMRALVGRGVFHRHRNGTYGLNPLGDTLRRDAAVSMAGAALFYGSPEHREHWSMLAESIRTGKPSIPTLRGMGIFDFLRQNDHLAKLFNEAMTSISELAQESIVTAYDFGAHRTIIDVGGGHGRLLSAILRATPSARGVLYDLPEIVSGADPLLRKLDVAERVCVEAGSFFDGVPGGGDAYVLKHIIHDWPDDDAVAILRNVRSAGGASAVVVLVETVIPDHDRDFIGKWADLEMLLGVDGRERTTAEYRTLLERAGLEVTRVIPTASPFSLVEAKAR